MERVGVEKDVNSMLKQEPITWSEQLPYKAYVTAFFTDQFIFRLILGHFFPRK